MVKPVSVPEQYGSCTRIEKDPRGRPLRYATGKKVTCGGTLVLKEVPRDWRKAVYVCDKCGEEVAPYILIDTFSMRKTS